MKLNLADKIGHSVITKDNKQGTVADFLFDEEEWRVRYLEVKFGTFFQDKRLLIPVDRVAISKWRENELVMDFSSKKLEKFPTPKDEKTVSRAFETEILNHFRSERYWGRRFLPSQAPPSFTTTDTTIDPRKTSRVPSKSIKEKEDNLDTSLRSFNELKGYEVFAKDDKVGLTYDLLIESENWELISFVIQAYEGMGYYHNVILSNKWIKEISYMERSITLSLSKTEVFSAPKFEESDPINETEVKVKLDYTGKPITQS